MKAFSRNCWIWTAILASSALAGICLAEPAAEPKEKALDKVIDKTKEVLGVKDAMEPGGAVEPIKKVNIEKDAESVKEMVDKLALQIGDAKVGTETGKADNMFKEISIGRHLDGVHEICDKFGPSFAALSNRMKDREASGAATPEDKAQFAKCTAHCDKLGTALMNLHKNALLMSTATRQQFVLDGWTKHQKGLGEVQLLAKDYPIMVKETMSRIELTGEGSAKPAPAP